MQHWSIPVSKESLAQADPRSWPLLLVYATLIHLLLFILPSQGHTLLLRRWRLNTCRKHQGEKLYSICSTSRHRGALMTSQKAPLHIPHSNCLTKQGATAGVCLSTYSQDPSPSETTNLSLQTRCPSRPSLFCSSNVCCSVPRECLTLPSLQGPHSTRSSFQRLNQKLISLNCFLA